MASASNVSLTTEASETKYATRKCRPSETTCSRMSQPCMYIAHDAVPAPRPGRKHRRKRPRWARGRERLHGRWESSSWCWCLVVEGWCCGGDVRSSY
eukprot:3161864-Prymnesium_polylepis.1